MIGKIKGTVREIDGNIGLIETAGGVFYQVFLTPDILQSITNDAPIAVYTYLHVKDNALNLYGFSNKKKYAIFVHLLGVDGVGPKLAYSIISFAATDQIIDAIMTANYSFFSQVPGVGKKTAQKILLEMSGKLNTEFLIEKTVMSADDATVVDALNALGFDRKDAHAILSKLDAKGTIESKIQQAIKLMTQK